MGRRRDLGPEFTALLSAAFITNLGDGMRLAAMPLLAASLTTSPLYVAALTAAQFLPWTTWAPFGGVIVDRSDRRRLILITQTWRSLLMLVLTIAVLADVAQMWQLIVVAFLITAGEILVDPSVVATIPQLVAPAELDRANGQLNTVEMSTNQFAGQTIGAVLFGFAPWLPFLIDAVSYGGSTAPFSRLPSQPPRPPSKRDIRADLTAGLRWIWEHPFLRPLTGSIAVFHLGTGGTLATLVLLLRNVLDEPPWVFGVVLALAGLTAAIASSFAAGLAERFGRRWVITVAATAVALSAFGAAASTAAWQVIAIWMANGAGFGILNSVGRGFVQRHTPNEFIGRTAIASRTLTRSAFVVGSLAVGAAAEITSIRWGLSAAGALHLFGAAMLWRSMGHEPPD